MRGVTADILDAVEAKALVKETLSKGIGAAKNKTSKKPATPRRPTAQLTQANPRTVQLSPTQVPKQKIASKVLQKGSKALAAGKFLAKKAPPASAAIMAYEAASLVNSEEAREKAREQYRVMGERGYATGNATQNVKNAGKNALQGLLDPVGTLYGVGSAIGDIASTHAKIAAQKFARRHQQGIKR